jgi:transcriptional regulator with XRE-family HTH domain
VTNLDVQEVARRVCAARAYARMSQKQLATLLGLKVGTMKRIEAGQRPITDDERRTVAAACEVPEAFFTVGFAAMMGVDVAEMRREAQALRAELAHRPVLTPEVAQRLQRARDAADAALAASEAAQEDHGAETPAPRARSRAR